MRTVTIVRKPVEGNVAANVLVHGCGSLRIDACRLPVSAEDREAIARAGGWARAGWVRPTRGRSVYGGGKGIREEGTEGRDEQYHELGRWPANVVLHGEDVGIDLASASRYFKRVR